VKLLKRNSCIRRQKRVHVFTDAEEHAHQLTDESLVDEEMRIIAINIAI